MMVKVGLNELIEGKTYFCYINSGQPFTPCGKFVCEFIRGKAMMIKLPEETWDGKRAVYKAEHFSSIYEIGDILWNE